MAAKILIATFQLGTIAPHNAGDIITDAKVQSQLSAQGAVLVDQASYPAIDALATQARKERTAGRRRNAEAIMLAGFLGLLVTGAANKGANLISLQDAGGFFATKNVEAALQAMGNGTAGNGAGMLKKTCTISQAVDLAGLGVGVKTFDKNVGTALPANARILAVTAESVTDFDDAAHGTYVMVVGTSAGGNQVGTSLNVAAGQTGFPKPFAAGAQGYVGAPQGAAQLSARITSSVDLNTVTTGSVIVNAFYFIQA